MARRPVTDEDPRRERALQLFREGVDITEIRRVLRVGSEILTRWLQYEREKEKGKPPNTAGPVYYRGLHYPGRTSAGRFRS